MVHNNILEAPKKRRRHLSSFQFIILGFLLVILIGSILLMLPISSKENKFTPFNESLFTSVSAVCVTGLVVHDTATYWSTFGHVIILILIQIGGLGVVTILSSIALIAGKKFSLWQRNTIQESISADQMGGLVKLVRFVVLTALSIEFIGACLMMPSFCIKYGPIGIWYSFFHSISAFCNAGFDILGTEGNLYPSLTGFVGDPMINLVIMALIVTGGIGFLTWDDVRKNHFHFKRYRMQTKVIIVTTTLLIFIPALCFFFLEFKDLPIGERILASLFQSVTPRTAGFNTVDLTKMSDASQSLTIILMLIGGSPGSTAGGIKTTTFAVLIINAISVFKRKEEMEAFGRRFVPGAVKNAATIFMLYLVIFLSGGIIISLVEGLPIKECLFEEASAIGTVGLSLGLTPSLGLASQIILMLTMFFGRVGGLTLIYATLNPKNNKFSKLPQEKITVG